MSEPTTTRKRTINGTTVDIDPTGRIYLDGELKGAVSQVGAATWQAFDINDWAYDNPTRTQTEGIKRLLHLR